MSDTVLHSPLETAHLALGAKIIPLGGWAMPVQYSVFEAELSNAELAQLQAQLQPCLKTDADKLTIYRLFKANAKIELALAADDELLYV